MAAVGASDCLFLQPVAGLHFKKSFHWCRRVYAGEREWIYGLISRSEYVFPAHAWHCPQLPAARLQLLGNHALPGFPFFLFPVRAWLGSRLEIAGPRHCQGLICKIGAHGSCLLLGADWIEGTVGLKNWETQIEV